MQLYYGLNHRKSIAHKLIWQLFMVYIFVSVLLISVTAYTTYQTQKQDVIENLRSIEASFASSLGHAIWTYDRTQIESLVKGLHQLNIVIGVRLTDPHNILDYTLGHTNQEKSSRLFSVKLPIYHESNKDLEQVATLELFSSTEIVMMMINKNLWLIIIAATFKLIILWILFLTVINKYLVTPLDLFTKSISLIRLDNLKESKIEIETYGDNELQTLKNAFNHMLANLEVAVNINKIAQKESENLNSELKSTIMKLEDFQEQLLTSEKMATLGGVAASIAHELKTPLSIAITSISLLSDNVKEVLEKQTSASLTRQDFDEFIAAAKESCRITLNNTQRAAELVRGFKNIAADQAIGDFSQFDLHEYLEEIVLSLRPKLKMGGHEVVIDCPKGFQLYSQPGAIAQIFTNFIMNSLMHGFDEISHGKIEISVKDDEESETVTLEYRDNGKGMTPEIKEKIFKAYVTTKRGKGGTGLGMHIVYNLVNDILQGSITVEAAEGLGTIFTIVLPTKNKQIQVE